MWRTPAARAAARTLRSCCVLAVTRNTRSTPSSAAPSVSGWLRSPTRALDLLAELGRFAGVAREDPHRLAFAQ